MIINAGSTDQSVMIRIVDSTDRTPETGVTTASVGLSLVYWRQGAATAIGLTEVDLVAPNDAHADGGLLHIGAGYYRLDLPDAAFAAGAAFVQVYGTVDGMIVEGLTIQLNVYTGVQAAAAAALTAYDAATATDVTMTISDPVSADLVSWNGAPLPPVNRIGCWHKDP